MRGVLEYSAGASDRQFRFCGGMAFSTKGHRKRGYEVQTQQTEGWRWRLKNDEVRVNAGHSRQGTHHGCGVAGVCGHDQIKAPLVRPLTDTATERQAPQTQDRK